MLFRSIILSRPSPPDGCRTVLPICYDQIVQLGDTSTNYQIQPGDRIYVPTRSMCESLKKKYCRKKCLGPCQQPQFQCPVSQGAHAGVSCTAVEGPSASDNSAATTKKSSPPALVPVALPREASKSADDGKEQKP